MARRSKYVMVAAAALLATGLIATSPGESQADTLPAAGADGLDGCVDAGLAADTAAWTCLGSSLTFLQDEGRSTAATDDVWQTMESSLTPQTQIAATPEVSISPMGAGDPWDPFCEYGTSCERFKDAEQKYTLERKQNGAWGDQDAIRGTYDVILLTNLNGRQVQYRIGFEIDTGPSIYFMTKTNCVKDQTFDGTCGFFWTYKTVPNWYQSNYVYLDKIPSNKGDNYFSTVTGTIDPTGWEGNPLKLGTFRTRDFFCKNNSTTNCYFP